MSEMYLKFYMIKIELLILSPKPVFSAAFPFLKAISFFGLLRQAILVILYSPIFLPPIILSSEISISTILKIYSEFDNFSLQPQAPP